MKQEKEIDLSVFEKVFSLNICGMYETCACGKTYYDAFNNYDWNEGEFENLENDKDAIRCNYGIELIEIDNVTFVLDCKCWHPRAVRIINWLNFNAEKIGEYFRKEKLRLIAEADKLPVDIKFPFPEGFRSMVSAPTNATNIQVLMEDGFIQTAHWAQDESGECQPPFRGWFIKNGGYGFHAIDEPIAWKPKDKNDRKNKG